MKAGFYNNFICLPQFIIASSLYWLHRFLIYVIPYYKFCFFRGIIADFLAPIVCIPIFATSQKFFGLRKGNKIYFIEIILYCVLFSVYFEIIGPKFIKTFTSDIFDVIAYFIGGVVLYFSQGIHLRHFRETFCKTKKGYLFRNPQLLKVSHSF